MKPAVISALCDFALAGGAAWTSSSLTAFLLNGGKLAAAVSDGRGATCDALMGSVRREVEKSYADALAKGHASSSKADVEAAFEQLDAALPVLKPTLQDIADCGFNARALVDALKGRLPNDSIFVQSDAAAEVLHKLVGSAFGLIRAHPHFMAELQSLGFERITSQLDRIEMQLAGIKLDAARKDALDAERHAATYDAIIRNTGLPARTLEPIFAAVSMEFPEADIEAKVMEAIRRIETLARTKIDTGNLGDDVRRIFEAAQKKLADTKDIDAAAKLLDPLFDHADHAMLAAAEGAVLKAEWFAAVYRWDDALKAWQAAARYNTDLVRAWGEIGDIHMHRGRGADAMSAYRAAQAAALRTGDERDLSISHERIGDRLAAEGDGAGALEAYRKGLAIRERLAARDPDNAGWQRDLSISHNKIGDRLAAEGDGAGALEAFRKGLAIAERLAVRDPDNAEWQRDLSISHDRIGDRLVAEGDGAGALEAFRKGLAIRERLAARDTDNAQWQRDLSVSHERIGDRLVAQGDGAGALEAFSKALAIAERLAARDPDNTEWQRDLSISHERIGDRLMAEGDSAGALEAFRKRLAIAERLAARDSENAQWQRDLIVSNVKLAKAGDEPVVRYARALEIARAMQAKGILAPMDAFIPGMLEERLAAAKAAGG